MQKKTFSTKIAGETSEIRWANVHDPIELKRLREIDRDSDRIKWFESRPNDYKPLKADKLKEFAEFTNDHLLFVVSGSDAVVSREKGKLQGWVKVNPDSEDRIQEMKEKGYVANVESSIPIILEISFVRRKAAAPHQMASAVRQVAWRLMQYKEYYLFPRVARSDINHNQKLMLTAYVIDNDPPNDASLRVLHSAGFEEKGGIRYDNDVEIDDRFFVLNWDKLANKMHVKKSSDQIRSVGAK